jgi:serine protease
MILGLFANLGPAWAADAPERMARGLIVKFKDGSTTSVVRKQGCLLPNDAASRKAALSNSLGRLQAWARVARRHRIDPMDFKATACGAHVIGHKHWLSVQQAQAEAATLRQDPDVEWVIPNEVLRPMSLAPSVITNDPKYSLQTWLHGVGASGLDGVGNIEAAWTTMVGRLLSPVVVAVLDSGILSTPEFDGRLVLPSYDFVSNSAYSSDGDGQDSDPTDPGFDPNPDPEHVKCNTVYNAYHGMTVTSMLASRTGNSAYGGSVLAPLPDYDAMTYPGGVLAVRVGGICGADTKDIVEGMLWAAGVNYPGAPAPNPHPAQVISISYGGDSPCDDAAAANPTQAAWLYRQAIDLLKGLNQGHGTLVVASAGNGAKDPSNNLQNLGNAAATMPANCPGVLAVTSLNTRGYKARYANLLDGTIASTTGLYGVAVAGGDETGDAWHDDGIFTMVNLTADPQNPQAMPVLGIGQRQGTSYAAPTVAGIAALMLAVDPTLTTQNLLDMLTNTARDFTPFGGLPTCVAASSTTRGTCTCTKQTCGAGVVDADAAIQVAMTHADNNPPGTLPPVRGTSAYASFINANAGQTGNPDNKQSGGGGGADAASLAVLLMALLAFVGRRLRSGRR